MIKKTLLALALTMVAGIIVTLPASAASASVSQAATYPCSGHWVGYDFWDELSYANGVWTTTAMLQVPDNDEGCRHIYVAHGAVWGTQLCADYRVQAFRSDGVIIYGAWRPICRSQGYVPIFWDVYDRTKYKIQARVHYPGCPCRRLWFKYRH